MKDLLFQSGAILLTFNNYVDFVIFLQGQTIKSGSKAVVNWNNRLTPDEKIAELEDKLARTFAEMENQRRRFEKEKDVRSGTIT